MLFFNSRYVLDKDKGKRVYLFKKLSNFPAQQSINIMSQFYKLRLNVQQASWADWETLFHQQQYYLQDSISFIHLSPINPECQDSKQSPSINSKSQKIKKQTRKKKSLVLEQQKNGEHTAKESIFSNEPQDLHESERHIESKSVCKVKRKPYPTNNFLPAFRQSFLDYLKKYYRGKVKFEDIKVIATILDKKKRRKGITLTDYQNMFNFTEFRKILQIYFRQKVILRDLMLSGVRQNKKREYFKKVHVFEEAFKSRRFKKINY